MSIIQRKLQQFATNAQAMTSGIEALKAKLQANYTNKELSPRKRRRKRENPEYLRWKVLDHKRTATFPTIPKTLPAKTTPFQANIPSPLRQSYTPEGFVDEDIPIPLTILLDRLCMDTLENTKMLALLMSANTH